MNTIVNLGLRVLPVATLLLGLTTGISCNQKIKEENVQMQSDIAIEVNKAQLETRMKKHLDAVTNRDLKTLESTLSPNGTMQLILPGTEIINGIDGFMEYHAAWFEASDWTFETKILNTEVADTMGMAVTEVIYREPERDGKPYFNRMIVSYDLQKIDDQWYVIKDHASSIEKSTDKIE